MSTTTNNNPQIILSRSNRPLDSDDINIKLKNLKQSKFSEEQGRISCKACESTTRVHFYLPCVHQDQNIRTIKYSNHWILYVWYSESAVLIFWMIPILLFQDDCTMGGSWYNMYFTLLVTQNWALNPVCGGQLHIWSQCSWPWSTPWSIAKVYNVHSHCLCRRKRNWKPNMKTAGCW